MSKVSRHSILALLAALAGLALAGPAAGAPAATPTPSPSPLPTASSWVGGKQLIGTGELTDLPAGVPGPPVPTAAAWLVMDLNTRQLLAGQRVHVPLAPASTLKIFTALALAHRLDPKSIYTARADDAAIDGTKVGLVPGSRYTIDQVLHGMLMASGNDCANALGNAVGGKQVAIGLIQDEARQLGAFDTVVASTSGLDAPGQVSSAYDLALAGSAALADPQLAAVLKTVTYTFPAAGTAFGPTRKTFQIQTHDRVLRNVPGATGVKNGYTVAARGSYVGSATRNGQSYLVVVLRAEGSTWHESRDLLEWAFAHGSQARPIGVEVTPGQLTGPVGPDVPSSAGTTAATPSAGGGVTATSALGRALPVGASLTGPVLDRPHAKLWLALAAAVLLCGTFLGSRLSRPREESNDGAGRHRT